MLHFGVQLPYAALGVIQHQWDTNHLDVWVVFPYPMDQTVQPPNNLWLCEADGVPKNTSASSWQDAFSLLLTVDDVLALPGTVTLEFDGPDDRLRTTWAKQWEPWGPILSVRVPYDWRDIIVVDTVNKRLGINIAPTHTLSIASADLSDILNLFHDNTDAWFLTTDGFFRFRSDEGTNPNTQLIVQGKGTGHGILKIEDGTGAARWNFQAQQDGDLLCIAAGSSPVKMSFIQAANVDFHLFDAAVSGKTPSLKIYGYRAGDALRSLSISVGTGPPDSASFAGLVNYLFDGIVNAAGGFSDNGTPGIDTTFLDGDGNTITVKGGIITAKTPP